MNYAQFIKADEIDQSTSPTRHMGMKKNNSARRWSGGCDIHLFLYDN